MGDNDIVIEKVERKIYTKEVLSSLRSSELSNIWPKTLDKCFINSYGLWDPVKSFDSSKPSDTKKTSFYETKSYRNNDKNKDDISLRPERRKWNDGCQVSSTKRNSEDNHSNSYRKSYQSSTPNNGGGDYERRIFNRHNNRNVKPRDNDREPKYNNSKPEKSSRNNSNLDERKDDKDGYSYSNNKTSTNFRSSEPEWFSNGPENCDETIELRGITANDSAIIDFKKDSTKNETKEEPVQSETKEVEKIVISFQNDVAQKPVFVETCITSPKREGSRFQDIFQKETKKESKDVENIIKAVLSENVLTIDTEKLSNVSKPLPNGVLTVEEIERGMTSTPVEFKRAPSKSTTIDTLPSFEPSQTSFLSSAVSSPSIDNFKVVNWLSNLNMITKEQEIEHKPFFLETEPTASISSQPMHLPTNYSKFPSNLQHPPGLPLMFNLGHMQPYPPLQQQQSLQQQQQQNSLRQQQIFQHQHQLQLQQLQQQQPMPQHLTLQQTQTMQQSLQNQKHLALLKQLSMGSSNHVNNIQRNQVMNIPNDAYIPDKYKLTTQQSLPNDTTLLSNFLLKNNLQMNHINDRNNIDMVMMNGPPGLTNINNSDKSMMMSRPIVKTNPPSFMDFAQMNDLSYQYPNNYRRPINNNNLFIQNPEMVTKPAQFNPMDMYKKLQPSLLTNNYPSQQLTNNFDKPGPARLLLDNLFNVNSSSYLPPLPQQAKYADQIETENI